MCRLRHLTIGLPESRCQSCHDPTYTHALMPAARAAQYVRLARMPTAQ